jgi:hypothetical protein
MKLFIKDLVTDEFFSLTCDSTDTIQSIKHQILMHQHIPHSANELTMVLYLSPDESDMYEQDSSEYSENNHNDKPLHTGLVKDYGIEEGDILIVIYPTD